MKTLDFTNGMKPNTANGEQYELIVEFGNGSRYAYHGNLKKEAENKFKTKFGNYHGIVKKEWAIV